MSTLQVYLFLVDRARGNELFEPHPIFCYSLCIMNKIKYISLEDLGKKLKQIIEDVYKNEAKYFVMVDNVPKAKICAVDGKEGKEIIVQEESEKKKLEEFIE